MQLLLYNCWKEFYTCREGLYEEAFKFSQQVFFRTKVKSTESAKKSVKLVSPVRSQTDVNSLYNDKFKVYDNSNDCCISGNTSFTDDQELFCDFNCSNVLYNTFNDTCFDMSYVNSGLCDNGHDNIGYVPLGEFTCISERGEGNVKGLNYPIGYYNALVRDTRPNFLSKRLRIPMVLNVAAFENYLQGYEDEQLVEFIKFGFPLDVDQNFCKSEFTGNHPTVFAIR